MDLAPRRRRCRAVDLTQAITIAREQRLSFFEFGVCPFPSTTDFHLVTETNGALTIKSLSEPSTNSAVLQWLDARDGQPSSPFSFGIAEVDADTGTQLKGERWLKLGNRSVLDVRTLHAYPFSPWGRDADGGVAGEFDGGGLVAQVRGRALRARYSRQVNG